MFIRCSMGDEVLIHLPENEYYEFRCVYGDYDDAAIQLILKDKVIVLRDVDYYCMGRPELHKKYGYVLDLFIEMVDEITKLVTSRDKPELIDIDKIADDLLVRKYLNEWRSKGLITIGDDGSW